MDISLDIIKENLKHGVYKVLNKATGATWEINYPSQIKYLYNDPNFEVYEPNQKTNTKANKK